MSGILVYLELIDGYVPPSSYQLLDKARELRDAVGGDVVGLALVGGADVIAVDLQTLDHVAVMRHPRLAPYTPEAHEIAVAEAIKLREPALVLFENSTRGLDLAAGVAARSSLPLLSYCRELGVSHGRVTGVSQVYGGRLIATCTASLPAVCALDALGLPEPSPSPSEERAEGSLESLQSPSALDVVRMAVESEVVEDAGGIDISTADRIVCVGRGIGERENVALAEEVASLLGAELAASRPVVDAGWLPKARQVGKSGNSVSPRLYLAVGVSGAPEHLAGITNAELLIAVNSDPAAPIFEVADYGAYCDARELLPALAAVLRR